MAVPTRIRGVLIYANGLMSSSQIDDGQTSEAESQGTVKMVSFIIRPAMDD
jgi:hypothetical protein